MKLFLFLVVFCQIWTFEAQAKLIKVAIIDTGLELNRFSQANLCIGEHLDLTGEGLDDFNGHGTNVTGLIVANAGDPSTYCIVIIKAYAMKSVPIRSWVDEAMVYAATINADVVNVSGGGYGWSEIEHNGVKALLNSKGILVAAAGNNRINLNGRCNYYPACYDKRIVVVGANEPFSNTGKIIDIKISGKDRTAFGITMTGTSQATAIVAGGIIKNLAIKRKVR